jgi:hypothetical protein
MKSRGLSMGYYALYQALATGGLIFSSLIMQFIAGRVSFYMLITRLVIVSFIGLTLGLVYYKSMNVIVFGMFLYTLGLGIFNNLISRLVMKSKNVPQSLTISMMAFIQTASSIVGIEIVNMICSLFHFAVLSYTITNFLIGCLFLRLVLRYAKLNKDMQWE